MGLRSRFAFPPTANRVATTPASGELDDPARSSTFAAFHTYPLFRRLWSASFGYTLSQWMQNIAMGWLAYELTDSERFVGLIAFAAGVPFIVISIPGGALLDRFDRRSVC